MDVLIGEEVMDMDMVDRIGEDMGIAHTMVDFMAEKCPKCTQLILANQKL